MGEAIARRFGRSLERKGDFTSALYTLTPLLEASLRHFLKLNGHDVTIFDDATQTQQDRTISSLFEQMRDELADSEGSRPGFRDDLARHSDLMSLGIPR